MNSINSYNYSNMSNLLNLTFGAPTSSSGTGTGSLDFSTAAAYDNIINSLGESNDFIDSELNQLQQNGAITYSPESIGISPNTTQPNDNPDSVNSLLQSSLGIPLTLADIGSNPTNANLVGQLMLSSSMLGLLGVPQNGSSTSSLYNLLGNNNYNSKPWLSAGTLLDIQG